MWKFKNTLGALVVTAAGIIGTGDSSQAADITIKNTNDLVYSVSVFYQDVNPQSFWRHEYTMDIFLGGTDHYSIPQYTIAYGRPPQFFESYLTPLGEIAFLNLAPTVAKKQGLDCEDGNWVYMMNSKTECLDMDSEYIPNLLRYLRQFPELDDELVGMRYWEHNNSAIIMLKHSGDLPLLDGILQMLKGQNI